METRWARRRLKGKQADSGHVCLSKRAIRQRDEREAVDEIVGGTEIVELCGVSQERWDFVPRPLFKGGGRSVAPSRIIRRGE